jgi:hypothetical protein
MWRGEMDRAISTPMPVGVACDKITGVIAGLPEIACDRDGQFGGVLNVIGAVAVSTRYSIIHGLAVLPSCCSSVFFSFVKCIDS